MSNYNNNRLLVPEAKQRLNGLKLETAHEIGLTNYEETDKGNLTSRQNGSVGGFMVKKMVQDFESHITTR